MGYKGKSTEEQDAAEERLREFLRLNYMTGAQAARQIGVRAETLYPWLQGKSRPASAQPINAFLDSMPGNNFIGIVPTSIVSIRDSALGSPSAYILQSSDCSKE